MVRTFSHGLVRPREMVQPTAAPTVLLDAMTWVLFASRTGLPSSATHQVSETLTDCVLVRFAGGAFIWSAMRRLSAFVVSSSPAYFDAVNCRISSASCLRSSLPFS